MVWGKRKSYMDDEKLWERFKNRFWSRVSPPTTIDGCMEWTGHQYLNGYGTITYKSRGFLAHRMAWFLLNGTLPDEIDHKCENKLCCNVNHLQSTTHYENMHHQWYGRDNNGK